ncbi:MAG: hypothetical protein HY302_06005 [Opitutae bacterium]|nr:hypothetical protein [Opitutae bacterium]
MQHHLLLVAAFALAVVGIMHSYLGERRVLRPLLALPDLPKLGGSRAYMAAVLRWAWHLTSVAWWGTAATLVVIWAGGGTAAVGVVLAATFALHAGIILLAGPRHPALPLFLLTTAALWLGSR